MQINVYDMLVFEDEDGNIYQDCVDSIDNSDVKTYNRRIIMTNCFELVIDTLTDSVVSIYGNDEYYDIASSLKLKEIWTRTDETTYKKVWSSTPLADTMRKIIPDLVTKDKVEVK